MRTLLYKYSEMFLSDTFVIACMSFELFVFACIAVAPEHIVALYEGNLVILTIEIMVCVFAVVWSMRRVVRTIKKERVQ